MCLYAHNIKPFKCHKDLVVYKEIVKYGGEYLTSIRKEPVKLGETLKAKGEFPKFEHPYGMVEVSEGAIHAYVDTEAVFNTSAALYYVTEAKKKSVLFAKAIIKAGTPFFVSLDCNEVAASELFITEELTTAADSNNEMLETRKEIYKLMRGARENTSNDGVKVGDVLLSDKTFVRAEDITRKTGGIVGIVAFIRPDEGTPQVISLDQEAKRYGITHIQEKGEIGKYIIPFLDMDGYGNTKRASDAAEVLSSYPGLEYCIEYETEGTKPGDWYMPSGGELVQMFKNAWLINQTVQRMDLLLTDAKAMQVAKRSLYWCSAERNWYNTWSCWKGYSWFYTWHWCVELVRPFLYSGCY